MSSNIREIGRRFSKDYQPTNRKKKAFHSILDAAANDSIVLSNDDIYSIYRNALSLDEEQLKAVVEDKGARMFERIIAKEILNKKGYDVIEKIVDRICGKSKQQVDMTTNGKDMKPEPIVVEVIDTREKVNNA